MQDLEFIPTANGKLTSVSEQSNEGWKTLSIRNPIEIKSGESFCAEVLDYGDGTCDLIIKTKKS